MVIHKKILLLMLLYIIWGVLAVESKIIKDNTYLSSIPKQAEPGAREIQKIKHHFVDAGVNAGSTIPVPDREKEFKRFFG
ncbi:MAG: hypothetical protein HY796_04775 [Elusimicrobia bacterium]|nr:hypothetical protein [Elusimicrobiota bacterium]